jgi:S1-C subfamily serine protease
LIEGRRVLTNAHVVESAATILVRRHGFSKKFQARILVIGYQCDLALLAVDDEAFWLDSEPLRWGGLPELQEKVVCVGYPTGGDQISCTCGIVSRVDVKGYVNRHWCLLAIQIDAAINHGTSFPSCCPLSLTGISPAGNSGGPVFMHDRVVGVAFSAISNAQNIGYASFLVCCES